MKTILIILSLTIFCSAQSDSLKEQVKITKCLATTTIIVSLATILETGKTGIIATKEAYNSEFVQNSIDSGKKASKKYWNSLLNSVDSVKK